MSSASKATSNRTNARASTGPKTATGKARTAKNALRHGLSLPVLSDPALSAEVETLAREIAGAGASAEVMQLAYGLAEAQIDWTRVRRARHDLLARTLSNPKYMSKATRKRLDTEIITLMCLALRLDDDDALVPPRYAHLPTPVPELEGEEKLAAIIADMAPEIAAFERYERRALSRRKFAIRAFDAARLQEKTR